MTISVPASAVQSKLKTMFCCPNAPKQNKINCSLWRISDKLHSAHTYNLTFTVHTPTTSLLQCTHLQPHFYSAHTYNLTFTVHTPTTSLLQCTHLQPHFYSAHTYNLTFTVHTPTTSLLHGLHKFDEYVVDMLLICCF